MSSNMKSISSSHKPLVCKNLQDYLKTLSKETLDKLYNYPATCLAVFRELPEMCRHFVVRLLFITRPVPQILIASWIPQADHGRENVEVAVEHKNSLQTLVDLHILLEEHDDRGNPSFVMNGTFQKYLKIATLGQGSPWTMSGSLEPGSTSKR
ncbi:General transcription factor IIH subunit 4 [Armadillidium vulgare]|nr:General transcription factor IIH subunit 4 [Armadillidium vulgare]